MGHPTQVRWATPLPASPLPLPMCRAWAAPPPPAGWMSLAIRGLKSGLKLSGSTKACSSLIPPCTSVQGTFLSVQSSICCRLCSSASACISYCCSCCIDCQCEKQALSPQKNGIVDVGTGTDCAAPLNQILDFQVGNCTRSLNGCSGSPYDD